MVTPQQLFLETNTDFMLRCTPFHLRDYLGSSG